MLRIFVYTILSYIWLIFGTIILGPMVLLFSGMKAYKIADDIIVLWSLVLLKVFGVKYKVFGIENIDANLSYVIMSNHRSHLDGPLLLSTLPIRFGFVIKRSLARIPIWGWAVTCARFVSIDRHDRTDSIRGMKQAASLVSSGRNILVFPEGTRSPTGDFLPFKKGGAVLAIESKVPILPVAIAGTYNILPRNAWWTRTGKAVVEVGKPISTLGMSYEDRDKLLKEVETQIRTLYEQANERLSNW